MNTEPDDQIVVQFPDNSGIPVDLAELEDGRTLCYKRENGEWIKQEDGQ